MTSVCIRVHNIVIRSGILLDRNSNREKGLQSS
jgi:hypothetical protein